MARESAFSHLPERNEREHLSRRAIGCQERDVAQQLHVDNLAGEHLDGCGVTGEDRERHVAGGESGEGGKGSPGHGSVFRRGAATLTKKTAPGAVSGSTSTPPQTVGHHGVLANMRRNYHSTAALRRVSGARVPARNTFET